nr:MAG TPA: hypothetical protein [Caudoviricetes sp.]
MSYTSSTLSTYTVGGSNLDAYDIKYPLRSI